MNFRNKIKLCAPKPAQTQSPKTLVAILEENAVKERIFILKLCEIYNLDNSRK